MITCGTGVLGSLVARRLVMEHGARHLLLCSLYGGEESLVTELEELGASARVEVCDVSDRSALETLLEKIPAEHPLVGVVHTAGVMGDGLIGSLVNEPLDRMFRLKVDAAWHLHELTRDQELSFFVMFSSIAGLLGVWGQGNYAAANSFLDALAQHRRAQRQSSTSLAWGYWSERSGMTAHLSAADLARMERMGVEGLSSEQGLALFDAALSRTEAVLAPVRLNSSALSALGAALPSMLRGLVRTSARRKPASGASPGLSERVAKLGAEERAQVLLELIRGAVETVLGVSSSAVEPLRPLHELGMDSLMAVELRNRLATASGLRLPATLLFDHPTPVALTTYLEAALLGQKKERASIEPAASPSSESIAIVGMGCRYPGGVDGPETLWRLLEDGIDATSEVPTNRGWDVERLYHMGPDAKGAGDVRRGGFLHQAAWFDAGFFGMNSREALAVDPQHRLLLETAWEALERAGVDPGSLAGSRTGVFVGLIYSDYAARLQGNVPADVEGYMEGGSSPGAASARVSYAMGLQGPAVTVNTACSASLVALHLACQSLRQGESDLALAGGVTLMTAANTFDHFSRQAGLSSLGGRCRSFSASADGVGWSEGVGMLALERLSDAQRHGHPVLALVRGSAINQAGTSQGMAAPNGPAQEKVIWHALASAKLRPADVDAVEGHGTGTKLGDPIEVQAILSTYGQERSEERPAWLGSLKSNIGHAQAAGGVGGVIKMVLSMRRGVLPKSLYAEEPSPYVDWSSGAVRLLSEARAWETHGRPRRAGVSSFGNTGTNAHVILEEAPDSAQVPGQASPEDPGALPYLLSARSSAALKAQASSLLAHLEAHAGQPLLDLSYSLWRSRSHFEHRAVLVAKGREQLLAALGALSSGQPHARVVEVGARRRGKLALLFSGQGSQRAQMGRELYESNAVFRRTLDEVFERMELGPSLREAMFAPQGSVVSQRLAETSYTQSALFALEVGLYRVLESWGIRGDYLLGHSVGEIAAAHVAGVLSLDAGCRLVSARGRLMQGDRSAVPEVSRGFEQMGIKSPLRVNGAFHSSRVEPMLGAFAEVVRGLEFGRAAIPVVSSVTGKIATDEELGSVDYWVRHARAAERFADGARMLASRRVGTYLELGPQGVLSSLAQECAPSSTDDSSFWPLLTPGCPEQESVLTAVGGAHACGHPVDWASFYTRLGAKRVVSLPTYPFQRERYWLESRPAASLAPNGGSSVARSTDPLVTLFNDAHERGRPDLAWELANVAANVRRSSNGKTAGQLGVVPVRLARGASPVRLICIPSLTAPTGPTQFSDLSRGLEGLRDVWVLPNPGYLSGEHLPDDLATLVDHQARALSMSMKDARTIVVGFSSGGWVANELVAHLERLGASPEGLVLLDTPNPADPDHWSSWGNARMPMPVIADDELTAAAAYRQLFHGRTPSRVRAPTLYVRAADGLAVPSSDEASWLPLQHTLVEVPGSHFSMMADRADITARAVHAWAQDADERGSNETSQQWS